MSPEPEIYKIGVNVPPDHLQAVMESVTEVMEPIYPGYDRVFNYWPVKGTWRPLPGSNPYDGKVGEISVVDEIRLEFAVKEKDLKAVIAAISDVHPYEEPAIDVLPMIPWKDLIPSDGERRRYRM